MGRARAATVAIIGAGAGGIAMGVKLKRAGYDFTIYEKSDGVGGTWRANTYPGAACDVPSHLYSFSFELNPWWSRTYATQPEILAYLERCTDQYGLRPHLRTGVAIREARWDDVDRHWASIAETGEAFSADVVVSGLGMLNVPVVPDSRARSAFGAAPSIRRAGITPSRSTANGSRRSVPVRARSSTCRPSRPRSSTSRCSSGHPSGSPRGSTGRTRPRSNVGSRAFPARRAPTVEIWWTYERADFQATAEQTVTTTALAQSYLERKITDPELRAKLTPDYPVGCKRPLISREWFPALTRPNVRLVTEPITEITERGIRTVDGEEHTVDTIIYGTGFKANEYLTAVDFYGRDGRRLHDDWHDGAEAYLGLTVSGYPNLSCSTVRTPTA